MAAHGLLEHERSMADDIVLARPSGHFPAELRSGIQIETIVDAAVEPR